jgi:hypothetical protein
VNAPRRTRTYNPLIKSQTSGNRKDDSGKDLGISPPSVGPRLATDTRQTDPDLATVVNAWDRLPEAVRAGIVAMVKAAL